MRRFHPLSTLLTGMFLLASASVSMAQDSADCYPRGSSTSETEELQLERIVRMQAQLVADAAEAYAADHGGVYPLVAEPLVAYLPGKVPLENAYYSQRVNPVLGAAVGQGEIGYMAAYVYRQDVPDGFMVTGFGKAWLLITLTSESLEEANSTSR